MLSIHRGKVEVNIQQYFSIIFRGEHQELQNNGLEHKKTDAIVRENARIEPFL